MACRFVLIPTLVLFSAVACVHGQSSPNAEEGARLGWIAWSSALVAIGLVTGLKFWLVWSRERQRLQSEEGTIVVEEVVIVEADPKIPPPPETEKQAAEKLRFVPAC